MCLCVWARSWRTPQHQLRERLWDSTPLFLFSPFFSPSSRLKWQQPSPSNCFPGQQLVTAPSLCLSPTLPPLFFSFSPSLSSSVHLSPCESLNANQHRLRRYGAAINFDHTPHTHIHTHTHTVTVPLTFYCQDVWICHIMFHVCVCVLSVWVCVHYWILKTFIRPSAL